MVCMFIKTLDRPSLVYPSTAVCRGRAGNDTEWCSGIHRDVYKFGSPAPLEGERRGL